MNHAGQKRKAAFQAEKEGKKEQYKKLWAESRALYDEADKLVDAHWKSVAPRKKELEEKLRAMTPVTEPTSGDIILNLTVNEQYPKDVEKDETVIHALPAGLPGLERLDGELFDGISARRFPDIDQDLVSCALGIGAKLGVDGLKRGRREEARRVRRPLGGRRGNDDFRRRRRHNKAERQRGKKEAGTERAHAQNLTLGAVSAPA